MIFHMVIMHDRETCKVWETEECTCKPKYVEMDDEKFEAFKKGLT